jgi:hypothetical protein
MGDGPIFPKTSAPHSLMTTYQISLISARSISLEDSTVAEENSNKSRSLRAVNPPNSLCRKYGKLVARLVQSIVCLDSVSTYIINLALQLAGLLSSTVPLNDSIPKPLLAENILKNLLLL